MDNFKKALVTAASAGALSIGLGLNPAIADPLTFTWSPAGAGLTTMAPGSNIVANDMVVTDFADIVISGGAFTENGVLLVNSFDLNGSPNVYTPPALAPTFNGLSTSYSLYVVVTAQGTTGPIPASGSGLSANGNFTGATYTFYGYTGAAPTITDVPGGTPTITGSGTAIPIFSGTLIDGTTTLTAPAGGGYSPTANLDLTLTACTSAGQVLPSGVVCTANETGFFVNPLPSSYQLVIGNFSATTSVTTLTPTGPTTANLDIRGGGGNVTFAARVPEPASLLIFGSSLIGLGFFGRRKRRAAQA